MVLRGKLSDRHLWVANLRSYEYRVSLHNHLVRRLTPSGQAKIDKLLNMASNYQQVEKTIMLLMQPNKVITRIPCISPLQAEDLRHIPVSSAYGQRLHPILNEYKHHSGVDLPGILGERVYATADGTVAEVGENKVIGKFVKLTHAYGFTTVYGHLSQIKVTDNGTVHIGQVIGLVGNTGRSTGPHLHYGVKKNGKEQNPLPYCYLYLHWLKMLNCEGKNSATLDHASSARSLPSVSSQCADLSPRSSYTRHQESPRFRLCELQYIPQAAYS